MNGSSARAGEFVLSALLRLTLLALIWWALARGAGWSIGVPVVLAATGVSLLLAPRRARLRARGVASFLVFFVAKSVSAGFDVARRAFARRPRLAPAMLDYPLRLPAGPARVLFANVISLTPGSLCVEIEGDRLCVHVLDTGLPIASQLRAIERRVGAIFGIDVAA